MWKRLGERKVFTLSFPLTFQKLKSGYAAESVNSPHWGWVSQITLTLLQVRVKDNFRHIPNPSQTKKLGGECWKPYEALLPITPQRGSGRGGRERKKQRWGRAGWLEPKWFNATSCPHIPFQITWGPFPTNLLTCKIRNFRASWSTNSMGPGLKGPLQVLPVLTDNDLFHGHRVLAELSEESPGWGLKNDEMWSDDMIHGGTPKMAALKGKLLLKWMIWGYHHFRKPPNDDKWRIWHDDTRL